ncbi:MAG TPA: hypothetical protein VKV19_10530 [Ktedonobacteraceae bacterium]|nr:hypothetical protein [Ktedonobacteraceae bacterium]
MHENGYRGPIYRALSRFIGERANYTHARLYRNIRFDAAGIDSALAGGAGGSWVVRGDGTWVAWQAAHAEAGQDPLKRPSMAFFDISCTLLIAVCKLAMFVSILYSIDERPAFYLPFRPTPEKSVLNVEGTT